MSDNTERALVVRPPGSPHYTTGSSHYIKRALFSASATGPIFINIMGEIMHSSLASSQILSALFRIITITKRTKERRYLEILSSITSLGIATLVPNGRIVSIALDVATEILVHEQAIDIFMQTKIFGNNKRPSPPRSDLELEDPSDLENAYKILFVEEESQRKDPKIIKAHYEQKMEHLLNRQKKAQKKQADYFTKQLQAMIENAQLAYQRICQELPQLLED